MAVSLDALMTAGDSSDGDCLQGDNVTSKSGTGITVGALATLIIVPIVIQAAGGTVSNLAVTWNSVSMTLGPIVTNGAGLPTVAIFSLVNPAAGALTLASSWTTTADIYMGAASFNGTDTVTGIRVADSTTANNVTQITVTSDADGATLAVFGVNGSIPTLNFSKVFDNAPLDPGGGSSYTLGGSSNIHTFTGAGGTTQALAGVHIIAPPVMSQMGRCIYVMP
jgi:hypothetical protein